MECILHSGSYEYKLPKMGVESVVVPTGFYFKGPTLECSNLTNTISKWYKDSIKLETTPLVDGTGLTESLSNLVFVIENTQEYDNIYRRICLSTLKVGKTPRANLSKELHFHRRVTNDFCSISGWRRNGWWIEPVIRYFFNRYVEEYDPHVQHQLLDLFDISPKAKKNVENLLIMDKNCKGIIHDVDSLGIPNLKRIGMDTYFSNKGSYFNEPMITFEFVWDIPTSYEVEALCTRWYKETRQILTQTSVVDFPEHLSFEESHCKKNLQFWVRLRWYKNEFSWDKLMNESALLNCSIMTFSRDIYADY